MVYPVEVFLQDLKKMGSIWFPVQVYMEIQCDIFKDPKGARPLYFFLLNK